MILMLLRRDIFITIWLFAAIINLVCYSPDSSLMRCEPYQAGIVTNMRIQWIKGRIEVQSKHKLLITGKRMWHLKNHWKEVYNPFTSSDEEHKAEYRHLKKKEEELEKEILQLQAELERLQQQEGAERAREK